MADVTRDQAVRHEWPYAGRRVKASGDLCAVFIDEQGREQQWSISKNVRHYRVGAVYAVDVVDKPDGGLSGWFDDAHTAFVRVLDDPEKVAVWRVADQAAEVRARVLKQHDKHDGLAEVLEVLRPIRAQYRKTDKYGRLGIEVLVLEYLRRSPLMDPN